MGPFPETTVLFSLTSIPKSSMNFQGLPTLELIYGKSPAALTMGSSLRLIDTETSEVAVKCRLEFTVLEDGSVHICSRPQMETRGYSVERYTFPFGRRAALTRGGRMMGLLLPAEDAAHAARIELAPGVNLELEESRNIRCWHCLARHRIKENKMMVCGHFGCRARLPALAVPYPLERPGFEPFHAAAKRIG